MANIRNQPIIGDLNSDGRLDRATLGRVGIGNHTCTVGVEYRRPDGTYRAPVVHSYTSPAEHEPYCPDIGVAIDLRGDGVTELVTTFVACDNTPNLLVLRNFRPFARYAGLRCPSAIETVDFNGDGLGDIWESTDEIQTMRALVSTKAGAIVPGPFSVCSEVPVPQHYYADYDGDGGQDVLVSRRCGQPGPQSGTSAEVYFGDGAPTAVLTTTAQNSGVALEVYPIDVDRDGLPDAGVIERHSDGTNFVRHFRSNGNGTFTEVPALTAFALFLAERMNRNADRPYLGASSASWTEPSA